MAIFFPKLKILVVLGENFSLLHMLTWMGITYFFFKGRSWNFGGIKNNVIFNEMIFFIFFALRQNCGFIIYLGLKEHNIETNFCCYLEYCDRFPKVIFYQMFHRVTMSVWTRNWTQCIFYFSIFQHW